MEYFVTGVILTTHGIKGELKVKILGDFDRFQKGNKLYLEYKNEYIEVIVKKKTEMPPFVLVTFENLEDINLVEKYRGSNIMIEKNDLTPLEENEFYYHELKGLQVFNQKGEERGIVVGVREVPQGHLLEVKNGGKIHLVPFILEEFVVSIDKEKIVLNEIEGLL